MVVILLLVVVVLYFKDIAVSIFLEDLLVQLVGGRYPRLGGGRYSRLGGGSSRYNGKEWIARGTALTLRAVPGLYRAMYMEWWWLTC